LVEQLSKSRGPAGTVTLRPVAPDDEPFLFQVYASTRLDELDAVGMLKDQQEVFLNMQYSAQREHYLAYYKDATWDIILLNGAPVGRLIVERTEQQITGIDVALLPQYRNAGVGSYLIRNLIQEATQAGKPFLIQVEKPNRARRLYERLGFIQTGESQTHYRMQWRGDR
jgi:ribosomal protein S18 acetylase RimI-like enzyme